MGWWDGIKRHHKALPADEVTVHEGIPVTSVPRTIFDLAATEDVDTIAPARLSSWTAGKATAPARPSRTIGSEIGRLRVAGYSVTRLTWNQLRDEPEAIASDLRVLLGDR